MRAKVPSPDAATGAATPAVVAPSGDESGKLPQTHDEPKPEGDAFDARARSLWDAIVSDDPDRAMPFFFPLTAYQQVKAIANPSADWKHRLVAHYVRDILMPQIQAAQAKSYEPIARAPYSSRVLCG